MSKSDNNLKEISNLTLTSIFLRPTEAYRNGGLDSICRGLLVDPGTNFDPHVTDEIQNHLFENNGGGITETHRFSLSAINIQRGRDHGIPSYNIFRRLVKLKEAKIFKDMSEIPIEIRRVLRKIYKNVNDIDAFTGGLSELPVDQDAILGPTFAIILGEQFRDLKFGDRFYFENGHDKVTRFKLNQLNEIRKGTMARIMCDNLDLVSVQKDAFRPIGTDNPLVSCKSLPRVLLSKWKNEKLPFTDQFK